MDAESRRLPVTLTWSRPSGSGGRDVDHYKLQIVDAGGRRVQEWTPREIRHPAYLYPDVSGSYKVTVSAVNRGSGRSVIGPSVSKQFTLSACPYDKRLLTSRNRQVSARRFPVVDVSRQVYIQARQKSGELHDRKLIRGAIGSWGCAWVGYGAELNNRSFVRDDALVTGRAIVKDDATVSNGALVSGNAEVSGRAQVYQGARIIGNNLGRDKARVYDDARVYCNAKISENATVYGHAEVYGAAQVYGDADVRGDARVYGNAKVYGALTIVEGNAQVYGNAEVYGTDTESVRRLETETRIRGNAEGHGEAVVFGKETIIEGSAKVYGDARLGSR